MSKRTNCCRPADANPLQPDNRVEKKNVYVGRVFPDGPPLLCSAEILIRRAWILGGTGSGKTFLRNFEPPIN